MIRIGVIGLGYWGPNLVRCFHELENSRVTVVCDRDLSRLNVITSRFPGVRPCESPDELLASGIVDAVVIATPTSTHYELALQAMERGLHVFVEKPLAQTSAQCAALIERAAANNVQLFVGHIFLHSAPVAALKELVDEGELGDVCYLSSTRLNLGPVRKDVNVVWDLAPHDVSIMLHLLGQTPTRVSCSGLAHLDPRLCDVGNLTMHFDDNRVGLIHVSWLDPLKRRVMTIVGSKKMAVYDDLGSEKVKIYDKGVARPSEPTNFGEFQFAYRYGGSYSPWLHETEPLRSECAAFVESIVTGVPSHTDGRNGAAVVAVLEAADRSFASAGAAVEVERIAPAAAVEAAIYG